MFYDLKKITIGTANLGDRYGFNKNRLSYNNFEKILILAKKNNITSIDTSPNYKNAFNYLKDLKIRNWKIYSKINKFPKDLINLEEFILTTVSDNLKKSNLLMFEGLMLHWPWDLNTRNSRSVNRALSKLKFYKMTKKIGISLYSQFLKRDFLNLLDLDFIQCPFNLVDQTIVQNKLLNYIKKRKIEIHLRSIFLQGILLNSKLKNKKIFKIKSNLFKKIEEFKNINNANLLNINLRFIFSHDFFSNVVIGFDNFDNFEEVINIIKIKEKKKLISQNLLLSNDERIINPYNWKNAK
jgi:aryl-alcohol dehydrogenase-like predicted oxidoreductase